MKITIRKSDNKLIIWNGEEINTDYEVLEVNCQFPEIEDINNIYYDKNKGELYVKRS